MTLLQKTLISATLVVAIGTEIYEARQASRQGRKVQMLTEQIQQLQEERDEAQKRLEGSDWALPSGLNEMLMSMFLNC